MKEVVLQVSELSPTCGVNHPSDGLRSHVQRNGWDDIAPIPVIEIPQELQCDDKRFSFTDGHHRYVAALDTSTPAVRCVVYDGIDDLREVSRRTGNGFLGTYDSHIGFLMGE